MEPEPRLKPEPEPVREPELARREQPEPASTLSQEDRPSGHQVSEEKNKSRDATNSDGKLKGRHILRFLFGYIYQ